MSLPTHLAPVPHSDGLHVWNPKDSGPWGYANCLWIVSKDTAAIIDTPYDGPTTKAMMAAARSTLGAPQVTTVVTTHANGDHSWGNHYFPKADIISTQAGCHDSSLEPGPEEMKALLHASPPDQALGWYARRHFSNFDFASARVTEPTIKFIDRYDFHVGDIEVELYEVGPAHHPGDLIARIGDTVCAGDIYFPDDHPCHWTGPLQNVIKAGEFVLSLNPKVIIPGHGRYTGPEELRQHLEYLGTAQREIASRYEAGLSMEEAMADIVERDFYPHMGSRERFMVLIAVEYSHLRGDSSVPGVVELATHAAQWAFDRRTRTLPAM
ncbi:MBL fold metallo-hydrolase [Streptomyces sp. NPDC059002]|uniref:MBL fold metallo-hydrolase n=1 Tax=Streptomyces sp. NPDC059002 TaxID=3346690 RepID=UPI00368EA438